MSPASFLPDSVVSVNIPYQLHVTSPVTEILRHVVALHVLIGSIVAELQVEENNTK